MQAVGYTAMAIRQACKKLSGYSYPEMLLALLMVGSFSTFSINKVLHVQNNAEKKAIVREAVASLSAIVHIGRLTGEMRLSNAGDYVLNHINAVKICPVNAYTEGCWDMAAQGDIPYEGGQPGFVLPNGATVMGADNWCCELSPEELCNGMMLDWNGPAGPNIEGEDQIRVEINYGRKDGETGWCVDNRRGTVNVDTHLNDDVWG